MKACPDGSASAGFGPAMAHGGDIAAARLRFPDAPEPWIDLSTGINPVGYPIHAAGLPETVWTRLPEPAQIATLEQVAGATYGVPALGAVVAASGTQPLIRLLPPLLPGRRVAILGFGYQEHPAVWQAAGADVRVVETLDALEADPAEIVVVINPNNPDGRLVEASRLGDLTRRLAADGRHVIVDEAFMDVVRPSQSLVPSLPENAVILRSLGKAYGLAGLRLSFAIAGQALAAGLRAGLGPWPVSGPAIAVGAQALADHAWLEHSLAGLEAGAARLDARLARAGLRVLGGSSLFRLAASPNAADWFTRLARAGLLVRSFPERPEWLRFGLPGSEEAWERLDAALS